MDSQAILTKWIESTQAKPDMDYSNTLANGDIHRITLPVSQYTYNEVSAACAVIAIGFAHLILKHESAFRMKNSFEKGIEALHKEAISECIYRGNAWWEEMQRDYSHQLHTYIMPFQVIAYTSTENTRFKFTEHSGVIGRVDLLNEHTGCHSLVALLRDIALRTHVRPRGTAAIYTRASYTHCLFFPGPSRNTCSDAPDSCLIFDSHPRAGATINVCRTPDVLSRHVLRHYGEQYIAAEFSYADSLRLAKVASSSSGVTMKHSATVPKMQLCTSALNGCTLDSFETKQREAVAESMHTPSGQFELLEMWME